MTDRGPRQQFKRCRGWRLYFAIALLTSSLCQSGTIAWAQVQAGNLSNQATYNYQDNIGQPFFGRSGTNANRPQPLVDPLGQILGCDGSVLPDYGGYAVALYEPDASGLELGNLVQLTRTELPDNPNNTIPGGKAPNIENSNPFFLTNTDQGRYNYLFDPVALLQSPVNAGLRQIDLGAQYILVVNPPDDTVYPERRILIEVLATTGGINNQIVRYRATALDGIPLSATGGTQLTQTVVEVADAETQSLNLFSLAFSAIMCEPEQIQVTKSADRAAAQPGDTIVYRLAIRNLVNVDLNALVATDTLPTGMQLLSESVFGQINGRVIPLDIQVNGGNVTFSSPTPIPAGQVVEIIYAVRVTPDAMRGDGENVVTVNAIRADNGLLVQDGPSTHRVIIDPGIISDCGTLIGRVFVDKNFDGEQQSGEAGIPNAVVFLDDGNRVVTDADGLFSVQNMLPGNRSGVLDFSSLPGYTLAPNLYFNERNSQSRAVHLAPGGLVRMNFGVTPTFREEAQ
jgi:uncharacterized repeat protein (TIGR01451 family)